MKATQGSVFRRREALITYLDKYDYGTVSELADRFQVSEVTIRRDFICFWKKKQLIERYYGGVKRIKKSEKENPSNLDPGRRISLAATASTVTPFAARKKLIFVGLDAGRKN